MNILKLKPQYVFRMFFNYRVVNIKQEYNAIKIAVCVLFIQYLIL